MITRADTAAPAAGLKLRRVDKQILAGGAVAVLIAAVIVVATLGGLHGPSTSPSSSTTSSAPAASTTTTPLGCSTHKIDGTYDQLDDPYCTQRELASRLCGVTLYSEPSIQGESFVWRGSGVLVQQTFYNDGSMGFLCENLGTSPARTYGRTFSEADWDTLMTPGSYVPPDVAAALGRKQQS